MRIEARVAQEYHELLVSISRDFDVSVDAAASIVASVAHFLESP